MSIVKKTLTGVCVMFTAFLLVAIAAGESRPVAAKTDKKTKIEKVKATISAKRVKIGKRIQVKPKTEGATVKISDSTLAELDSAGFITGKKAGSLKVYVRCKGKKTRTFDVSVVTNPGKPQVLPLTLNETGTSEAFSVSEGRPVYSMWIKNNSKTATINRIVYYYTVKAEAPAASQTKVPVNASGSSVEMAPLVVASKTLTVTAANIPAGKSVKAQRTVSDGYVYTGSLADLSPWRIELYAGEALYVYEAKNKTYSLQWGVPDKKPPVITGLVKESSSSGYGEPYRIYYSDRKDTYNFAEFVSAEDERDGRVNVTVDTSKINWKKTGKYKIYFRASDKVGNTAVSWARVQIYVPGKAESGADRILKSVIKEKWSEIKKIKAIYRYMQKNYTYNKNSKGKQKDWRKIAAQGLKKKSGGNDLYYAVSRLLLTRAGIRNVMIRQDPAKKSKQYQWNLVYTENGWYHFDAVPGTGKEKICLWTDKQLGKYSGGREYRFKSSAFQRRGTKKISKK